MSLIWYLVKADLSEILQVVYKMSESWEKKTNLTSLCIKGLLMVVHLLIAYPNLNSVFDWNINRFPVILCQSTASGASRTSSSYSLYHVFPFVRFLPFSCPPCLSPHSHSDILPPFLPSLACLLPLILHWSLCNWIN